VLEDRTTVLLILSREVLDEARVVAAKATITLKLPVSLQIVLRALIEEGLKRGGHPAFLASVESQARAVRHRRRMARRAGAQGRARESLVSESGRLSRREPRSRRK
jgi:hypothetical protein